VTAGGVPLNELNLNTLQSRICDGLYLCGEICDVDGRIGGFNFQCAWASGYGAGFTAGVVEVNSSFDGNGNYVGNSIGPGVEINVHSTYSATFTYSKKHGIYTGGL